MALFLQKEVVSEGKVRAKAKEPGAFEGAMAAALDTGT